MKTFLFVSLLIACEALAGNGSRQRMFVPGGAGGSAATTSTASTVTTADMTFYVDPLGSDSNACTSSGAGACRQPQAAINKMPKIIRHKLTLNLAAGTYTGFYLTNFQHDGAYQQSSGGIQIDGVLATSTLATGTATGTATSGTAGTSVTGSVPVRGTLVHTGQVWTASDLRGRYVSITSGTGSGQIFAIADNTADTITIAGSWTAPTGTSVYVIQDAAAILDTGVPGIAVAPTTTPSTTLSMIQLAGNNLSAVNSIQIRYLRLQTIAATQGVNCASGQGASLNTLQVIGTTGSKFPAGANCQGMSLTKVVSIASGSTAHVNMQSGPATTISLTNNLFYGGGWGILSTSYLSNLTSNSFVGQSVAGIYLYSGVLPGLNFNGTTIICDGSGSSIGVYSSGQFTGQRGGALMQFGSVSITSCNTAVKLIGSIADFNTLGGSALTTGIDVSRGGQVSYGASTMALTAVTNDILVDGAQISGGTFAALTAGNCTGSFATQSTVCER